MAGNTSGVDTTTRPFTDVTTNADNQFTGTIPAQSNGLSAGVDSLSSFDAEFQAQFVVAEPTDLTVQVVVDDGFLFGVGGGA